MASNGSNDISALTSEFLSGKTQEFVDPITFIESPWGLHVQLYPVQRFVVKCMYGMKLDNEVKDIHIPDMTNEHLLYTFTEVGFLEWLYAEKRCNVNSVEGKNFHELILVVGRRSGKCRASSDVIATTVGTISFGELLRRHLSGEKIGITTYDMTTYKRHVTYDWTAWDNGRKGCVKVETSSGIVESSSFNHPYLVWRDDMEHPDFVNAEDLKPGDKIAIADKLDLFGPGGMGTRRAAILGYLQGDGGTTHNVGYTTGCPIKAEELARLVSSEFPLHELVLKKSDIKKQQYSIVKDSRREKQNGSQKNEVKEWLKSIGCFGTRSKEKSVPDCIMRASRPEVSMFISRLFACDGYASVNKKIAKLHSHPTAYIGITLASKKLIDGIRHLLLKFGIHCRITQKLVTEKKSGKTYDAWELSITDSQSITIFDHEVGIFSKEDAVKKVVEIAQSRGEVKNQMEFIPRGVWSYLKTTMRNRGLSASDVVGKHGRGHYERLRMQYSPLRRKVSSYGKIIGDDFLQKIGESDICWDTVESIVPVGLKQTIDLSVPGTHVIGGDIISHNSLLAACLSDYELYRLIKRQDPSKHYKFPPYTEIDIVNVATTDEQSDAIYHRMMTLAKQCPYLRDRIQNETKEYFNLRSDADLKMSGKPVASINARTGSCSSAALRGKNALIVNMDEFAFFIDNGGRYSGDEVYKALSPSIASFGDDGKMMLLSSPYAKYGKFWDRYNESFEEQDTTLMFKMYTSMMNPTIQSAILKSAKRRDRVSFMGEYGGEFSDSVVAWVDDEFEFKKCISARQPQPRGIPDVEYYCGIDLGFKNDGTAIAIVHDDGKRIVLDYADVWYSGSSDVWDFDKSIYGGCRKYAKNELIKLEDIIEEVKELHRWFPIKRGMIDQHNGYAMAELLVKGGFKQFEMEHFTDLKLTEVFQLSKTMYAEQLLDLYDHPVLVPEILTLEAERKSRDKIIVRKPNRRGAHDDISDAFTRACWVCFQNRHGKSFNLAMGPGQHIAQAQRGASSAMSTPMGYALQKVRQHGVHPRLGMPRRRLTGSYIR